MTLPPGPMTSRILSGLMCRVTMRGAYIETSVRGVSSAFSITLRMNSRASRA